MSYPQAILISILFLIMCFGISLLVLPYIKYIPLTCDFIEEQISKLVKLLLRKVKTMVNLKKKDEFKKGVNLLCQDEEFKDLISRQQEYIESLVTENEKLREILLDSLINYLRGN